MTQKPALLSLADAESILAQETTAVAETEHVNLKAGLNRILAEDITARVAVPPFRNAAMDGYAYDATQLSKLPSQELDVVGTAYAGKPFTGEIKTGQCVRIMTGATLPANTDTVIMQENVERLADRIGLLGTIKAGQHVRLAGEDIQLGQTVLKKGQRLKAADLGLLASIGYSHIAVYRKLKVAFFSTGDELVGTGHTLAPGQIYDSNRYSLYGLLSNLGVTITDLGVIPDDKAQLQTTLDQASAQHDVVITTGGVSVGDADYISELLTSMGEMHFWQIAIKPGKPLAYGKLGNSHFFGLPGNPVSAMATFYIMVLPALRKLMGDTHSQIMHYQARCTETLRKKPGRADFQRGILSYDKNGDLVVHSTGPQGSHRLSSMSLANCFIALSAEQADVAIGQQLDVIPFSEFN